MNRKNFYMQSAIDLAAKGKYTAPPNPNVGCVIVENSKIGKHLVIVPIAFVSEHSETLVELDIEYAKLAKKNGCENYTRVEALGINKNFIESLSDLILHKDNY